MLIVSPENVECFETINILNYFGFPLNTLSEETFTGQVAREHGFAKTEEYPLMYIESSHEEVQPASLSEKDTILAFLYNQGLIGSYKSHSAFEK